MGRIMQYRKTKQKNLHTKAKDLSLTISHLNLLLQNHRHYPLLASSLILKLFLSTSFLTPRCHHCCFLLSSSCASYVFYFSCVFCAFSPSCVSSLTFPLLNHCLRPRMTPYSSSSFSSFSLRHLNYLSLQSFFLVPHHRPLHSPKHLSSFCALQEKMIFFVQLFSRLYPHPSLFSCHPSSTFS